VRADLNGDLNQDLIFENGDPHVELFEGHLGNGNGTFQSTAQSLPNPLTAASTYVRDLDLDSRDDYITTDGFGNAVLVALQTGGNKNCAPRSSAKLAAKICAPASGSSPVSPVLIRAGQFPRGSYSTPGLD